MKYKVGDKLRVLARCCHTYDRADKADYIVIYALNSNGYFYNIFDKAGNNIASCEFCLGDTDLAPYEAIFSTLEVGHVVLDQYENEYKVIHVTGPIIFLERSNDRSQTNSYSVAELEAGDWTIKGANPEPTELSVAELEEKLEMPSGSLRIKKD